MNNNQLTEFNVGNSHENNPLGGIPQGMGNNGQLNTVEQGETKKDSFIYSNRITLTPQVIAQFNLPKSLAGKTAADATKLINNKFEGRNSKIDNNTKKAFLDRIAEAQETIKAEEQTKIQEAMQINSTEVPDMMEGQIPQGMEEFVQPQQQMAYGGKMSQNQMLFGGNSQQGQMAGDMTGQVATTAADMFFPGSGQFLKMGDQFGTQVGNMIGGDKGEQIGGLISPMGTLKGIGTSIATGNINDIPGIGLFGGKTTKQKEILKMKFNKDTLESNSKVSNFAFGGDMTDPKKQALGDIATKKDTMFVQKYSQDKKKELLSKGYVKQKGFKKDDGYSDVHNLNDNALKMLKEDWNNGKRRDIVDLNNNRLSKPFDPNFYQKQHETNPNVYYNLEGANALGVINPNTNYLAFDKRINPNIKSEWINPKTGDGVEFYEYDFGSKYDTPAPKKINKTNTIGKNPAISQSKKISANPNVSKKPAVTPNQISPVSAGYKFAMGGNMYEGGGELKPWQLPSSKMTDDPNFNGGFGFKNMTGAPYATELPLDQQINVKYTPERGKFYKQSFNQTGRPQISNDLGYTSKLNYNDPDTVNLSPEQLQETNGYSNPELAPENKYVSPYPKAKLGETLNKAGKYVKDNYGNALRYAPVAMNAYQLSKMGKPEVETLDRLGNKYNPQYMDEKALTNQINAETNYTANALANASNGSLGSLSNNILGMQLNKTKALSDAYSKVADVNRNEDKTAQQFNLGVDQFNVGQSNQEKDINARNRGAFKTERSKLLGQIGNDLGNIGKETVYKKLAKEAFGYTYDGEYVRDDKGKVVNNPDTGKPMTKEDLEKTKKYAQTFNTLGKREFGSLSLNNKNTKE